MHFFRGQATASATGLFVIGRFLAHSPEGRTEHEISASLQMLKASSIGAEDSGPVLAASLAIGEALGILEKDRADGSWTLGEELRPMLAASGDQWPKFRGALLRRIAEHGLAELAAGREAPDLVVGLTWFLQQDPLRPLPTAWSGSTEVAVRAGTLGNVDRSEQWRPFQRWVLALGLARRADTAQAKVLIPDSTTAIGDQIASMPAANSAREWLSLLRDRLPMLGAPELLDILPTDGAAWSDLPPGLVLGLRKLEKRGVLRLEPSDDATGIVSIGLGSSARQIGRVVVLRSIDV